MSKVRSASLGFAFLALVVFWPAAAMAHPCTSVCTASESCDTFCEDEGGSIITCGDYGSCYIPNPCGETRELFSELLGQTSRTFILWCKGYKILRVTYGNNCSTWTTCEERQDAFATPGINELCCWSMGGCGGQQHC